MPAGPSPTAPQALASTDPLVDRASRLGARGFSLACLNLTCRVIHGVSCTDICTGEETSVRFAPCGLLPGRLSPPLALERGKLYEVFFYACDVPWGELPGEGGEHRTVYWHSMLDTSEGDGVVHRLEARHGL